MSNIYSKLVKKTKQSKSDSRVCIVSVVSLIHCYIFLTSYSYSYSFNSSTKAIYFGHPLQTLAFVLLLLLGVRSGVYFNSFIWGALITLHVRVRLSWWLRILDSCARTSFFSVHTNFSPLIFCSSMKTKQKTAATK